LFWGIGRIQGVAGNLVGDLGGVGRKSPVGCLRWEKRVKDHGEEVADRQSPGNDLRAKEGEKREKRDSEGARQSPAEAFDSQASLRKRGGRGKLRRRLAGNRDVTTTLKSEKGN